MLIQHFKFALRSLLKRKTYSLINIIGFATGMAACIIILSFVLEELSYDRFHENTDRIYRLTTHADFGENQWNTAITTPALAPVLQDEFAEIESVVRLDQFDKMAVTFEDKVYLEDNVLSADASFFQIFSFPLIEGDPVSALKEPYSLAIGQKTASKYFENSEDILGKTLHIDDQPYKITAVLDQVPENSHMHFDMVFSFNSLRKGISPIWSNINTCTYVLIRSQSDAGELGIKMRNILMNRPGNYAEMSKSGITWETDLQALSKIHLYSQLEDELEPNGHIRNVYIFSLIAIFIFMIACVNYINLTTAKSSERAKDIGIRKVLGSTKTELIYHFLAESVVITSLSLIIGLFIALSLKSNFVELTGRSLSWLTGYNLWIWTGIAIAAILIGILAGWYPSMILSRFKPIQALSGKAMKQFSINFFRNSLVTFQFMISIGLITCTLIIGRQINFIKWKDIGVDKENVLVIQNADKLGNNQQAFIHRLNENPQILSVSHSDNGPFEEYEGSNFIAQGKPESERRIMNFLRADENYIQTLGIQMEAGRNFSKEFRSDSTAIVINRAAAKSFGFDDPVGKTVLWGEEPLKIIGVTEDFHFRSLHAEIGPLVFVLSDYANVIEAKIRTSESAEVLENIQEQWKQAVSGSAPIDYYFLDSDFEQLFQAEQKLGNLFLLFSILAIAIACIGLLALAAYMVERKTKEIGIRKVLGASVTSILVLLTKNFTLLVLLAFVLISPIVYWFIGEWLHSFAYRINLHPGYFLYAGLMALIIAWLTVGFHSLKAALANPVKALKEE